MTKALQAVRNQLDLNVTSMPQKYRRMADFHEYYSGARTAPYLTVFIGGNHEASNHLFELYYGGWVAPNIYYLGAANVLQFGPLRIAGLTGIWKGYDYRKPHHERLPYNQEETGSIYHVRELDVRKLLSLRSQVDIGLSHDWPQGIEMHGDHRWLFRTKRGFENDSKTGKLGSVAARQCLDRLRPPHWFSAHLHTKFGAVLEHGPSNPGTATPTREDQPQVNAWQQFHAQAQRADAQARDQYLKDKENREEEAERSGVQSGPQYTLEETFNKIEPGYGFDRKVIETTHSQLGSEEYEPISNLDGCGFSRPTKRQRLDDAGMFHDHPNGNPASLDRGDQADDNSSSVLLPAPKTLIENPDAIDIDMSDENDDDDAAAATDDVLIPRTAPLPILSVVPLQTDPSGNSKMQNASRSMSEESDGGGVKLSPFTPSLDAMPSLPSAERDMKKPSKLSSSFDDSKTSAFNSESLDPEASSTAANSLGTNSTQSATLVNPDSEVSEEMRAQLAALSSNFTQPVHIEVSPNLPFPPNIFNKTTEFLALGKCEPYQEFLQLLSVQSITNPAAELIRPLSLSYDPEWLAIQRVFASELQLGGHPTDKVPRHRGDTYYRDQILQEQEWIAEHVVKPGKLPVPLNFSLTAPIYDPSLNVDPNAMPHEMTNPQTSAFCELIGIKNQFDISEEEREFRRQQGPRLETASFTAFQNRPRGGGQGGGRGRGGGGGGGRGFGRGGGRGRGRGRW